VQECVQDLTHLVQVHEQILSAKARDCGDLLQSIASHCAQPLLTNTLRIITRAFGPATYEPEFLRTRFPLQKARGDIEPAAEMPDRNGNSIPLRVRLPSQLLS
jgi:hypothetical protein